MVMSALRRTSLDSTGLTTVELQRAHIVRVGGALFGPTSGLETRWKAHVAARIAIEDRQIE